MKKQYIKICYICGKEFESGSIKKYSCKECDENVRLVKKLKMLDKAEYSLTHIIGKNGIKFNINISKEVDIIKKRVESGIDNFSSKPEAIVALQLERRGIRYESQKSIGGKNVDFYLPNMKIVLEIDGELYHTDENEKFIRDRAIMRALGEKYEIVHIEASLVPSFTWKLDIAIPMLVSWRNEKYRFRDSTRDSEFLMNAVHSFGK